RRRRRTRRAARAPLLPRRHGPRKGRPAGGIAEGVRRRVRNARQVEIPVRVMVQNHTQDSRLSPQDYLFPLVIFDDVLWPSDSAATLLHASALPEPYRGLLAHTEHMTVTMEAFYGAPVAVRVLNA